MTLDQTEFERSLRQFFLVKRETLARYHHPAFAQLDLKRLQEALLSIVDDPQKKGGARRHGAVHIAAELAIEVKAFGFAISDEATDDDKKAVLERANQASSRGQTGGVAAVTRINPSPTRYLPRGFAPQPVELKRVSRYGRTSLPFLPEVFVFEMPCTAARRM